MSSLLLPEKGKSFTPTPAGNHFATCYRVIDLGTQEVNYPGTPTKRQHKVLIGWEIPGELNDEGKPFTANKKYTLSSHEKSTFRQHLESWRGRPFTDADFGHFDIATLLGVNCFLNIVHEEKNGSVYSNITSVTSLPKGMNLALKQKPINPTIMFSLANFDQAIFDSLSEKMQELIAQSPEYREIKGLAVPLTPVPNYAEDLTDEIPF